MTTALSSPPVLPEHVKKPNEEEFKKTIESINASIEKIQKQFVSFFFKRDFIISHQHRMLSRKKSPSYLPKATTRVVRKSRVNLPRFVKNKPN
jgi:hypothetical protein